MVELIPHGVYLLDGQKVVNAADATGMPSPDESRENTITYGILRAHDVDGGKEKRMHIRFDAMVSHDIGISPTHSIPLSLISLILRISENTFERLSSFIFPSSTAISAHPCYKNSRHRRTVKYSIAFDKAIFPNVFISTPFDGTSTTKLR